MPCFGCCCVLLPPCRLQFGFKDPTAKFLQKFWPHTNQMVTAAALECVWFLVFLFSCIVTSLDSKGTIFQYVFHPLHFSHWPRSEGRQATNSEILQFLAKVQTCSGNINIIMTLNRNRNTMFSLLTDQMRSEG